MLSDHLIVGVFAPTTSQPHTLARVVPDEPVPDCGAQHSRRNPVALGHRGRRQPITQLGHPLLDCQMIDLGQRRGAPSRHNMVAHDRRIARRRGDLVVPRLEPPGRVGREAEPTGVRVDVKAATDRAFHLRKIGFRLPFRGEGLGPLPAGGVTPIRAIPTGRCWHDVTH